MQSDCLEYTVPTEKELLVFNPESFEDYPEVGIALGIVTKAYHDADKNLTYHNLAHTVNVAGVAAFFAKQSGCTEVEIAQITTAALFHDIGYVRNENGDRILQEDGHQERSANIFRQFAERHREFFGNDGKIIDRYAHAIQCTDLKTEPENDLIAIIMLDADLWVMMLDPNEYLKHNGDLKNECCSCEGWSMAAYAKIDHVWYSKQGEFIDWRHFLTPYAKENWESRRQANAAALKALAEQTSPKL